MASDKVCMPIRFLEGRFEYCEIELENLTKESFLENVSSCFPKTVNASKMLVCDDKGVVVPFHLLAKVIKMHHLVRHDFSLKITFEDKSEGAELTKSLRAHLMARHLKHILTKAEKNEEDLSKMETIKIIDACYDFIKSNNGFKPTLWQRKNVAKAVQALVPRLTYESAFLKLTAKMKNSNRPKKKAQRPIDDTDGANADDENSMIDYEELLDAEAAQHSE